MIKQIILSLVTVMGIGVSHASVSTSAAQALPSKQTDGMANADTRRVSGLFDSLAEQTAALLLYSVNAGQKELDQYVATIQSIAAYSDNESPFTEADINLLTDSFYNFVHAGGEQITKDEIRSDLSRFSTLGAAVKYLSEGMLEGLSE